MIKKIILVSLLSITLQAQAQPGLLGAIFGNDKPSTGQVLFGSVIGAAAVGANLMKNAQTADYLSYHLNEVKNYFNNHPKDFVPIKDIVLNTLGQPNDQDTYDRYRKLAEKMRLKNISERVVQADSLPNKYTNPIADQLDNNYENPIQEQPYSNIIYTPQGDRIDTSTEFPNEHPQNWKDYLLIKQHSTELAKNLINAGDVKLPDTAAHHIVPATHPLAQGARDILEKYKSILGEDAFNNAINGVFLPTNSSSSQVGIIHNGKHPNAYVTKINDIIVQADKIGGLPQVINELNRVKNILQNPPPGATWSNIL